jgi:hypothetical protein
MYFSLTAVKNFIVLPIMSILHLFLIVSSGMLASYPVVNL